MNDIDKNNIRQNQAFELIEGTNVSFFLTGRAGSGKTTFLRRAQEEINKNGGALSASQSEALFGRISALLKQTIRPEFLNRIDETIMFTPLNKDEIAGVVRLQMNAVSKMLEQQGFNLRVTDKAVDYLAQAGFDPEFGARPVKRAIQRDVLNALSKSLLAGEVTREHEIIIDANDSGITFRSGK